MNLFFNELENIITIPDEHWYQSSITKAWLPSVTNLLSAYPKGKEYEKYLQQVGMNAPIILKHAGIIGSETHDLIDEYEKLPPNYKTSFLSEDGKEKYKFEVWQLYCKAMEFFNKFPSKIIVHEFPFANDELGYGGRIDRICELKNQIWLIDYK